MPNPSTSATATSGNSTPLTPFLKQVADHYYNKGDIESTLFVFPSKRSTVFFKKYLSQAVKGHTPIILPTLESSQDFYYRLSGKRPADRITLLLKLYDCYKALVKNAEPLDEFIFWGDVILKDFSEVDLQMVNPREIFTDVRDFKSIDMSPEYLSKEQMEAIESFLRHFKEKVRGQNESGNGQIKDEFLQVWQILYPLYASFRESLSKDNLCYEGMAYRSIVERLDGKDPGTAQGGNSDSDDSPGHLKGESIADILRAAYPKARKVVFVGLSMLYECEKRVMLALQKAGMASFCWNYCSSEIKDPLNRSHALMDETVKKFPMEWELERVSSRPEVSVISVPSGVGQAKQIPSILTEIEAKGEETAIVLPDETLLPSVLNSIPPDIIKDVNVTMGAPISTSAFHSFMKEVCAMQMHLRSKKDSSAFYFYHRQVGDIFSNSVFRQAISQDEEAQKIVEKIKKEVRYYIPEDNFKGSEILETIFRPVAKSLNLSDSSQIKAIGDYLREVVGEVTPIVAANQEMHPEVVYAKMYLSCINLLSRHTLEVIPATYFRILDSLLEGMAIPYEGEPLRGLQVMGFLETRGLDFKNLVILSCSEGTFPKRSFSPSFIPPVLRRGFSLPTSEDEDAKAAYNFYSVIQRAKKVYMLYDSRAEGIRSGEESRFVKQIRYHFTDIKMDFSVASGTPALSDSLGDIPKPSDIEVRLKDEKFAFSATTLQNYLSCPVKFYYSSIEKLRAEDEVAESMDAGMIGNVLHSTMQALYLGPWAMDPSFDMEKLRYDEAIKAFAKENSLKEVSQDYIESWLSKEKTPLIKARIRSFIERELHTDQVGGRDLVTEEIIYEYVVNILKKDLQLLKDKSADSFQIIGLEMERRCNIEGYAFKGFIDRMDCVGGEYRIVDYKTGKVEDSELDVNKKPEKTVAALFGKKNASRPKIAIQLYLYDKLTKGDTSGKDVYNVIYSATRLFKEEIKESPVGETFSALMDKRLKGLLEEIANPSIPFRRTTEAETCKWCNFKALCGR